MALGEKSHYVVEKPQWYHRLKSYFSKDGKLLGTELSFLIVRFLIVHSYISKTYFTIIQEYLLNKGIH